MKSQPQQQSQQQQSPLFFLSNLLNAQFQLTSILSRFIIFGCGLTFGILISLHFKSISFNLQVTPLSPPPPEPPSFNSQPDSTTFNASTTGRTGMTEYLRLLGNEKHEMEDDELIWKASMVPQIKGWFPHDRKPKIAFMFLARWSLPMAPLWEKFFKGHHGLYSIYVHTHPSFNETESTDSVFYGRRIPSKEVEWGKVNMIEAERRLVANALLDFSNQRFVLLSESCIPLFNFQTIYSYLMNATKSHIQVYDEPGSTGRGRYRQSMRPEIQWHQWRKGSQWFEIGRDLAVAFVSDQIYFPKFQSVCKNYSCYSDEHYLPTFMHMKFPDRNSNRSLTWVDWSRGGPHPARFIRTSVTFDLLHRLRNEKDCDYNGNGTNICFLFARKFTLNALDRLLRFAPKIMGFNP